LSPMQLASASRGCDNDAARAATVNIPNATHTLKTDTNRFIAVPFACVTR
jgi:hypothetical protein